MSVTAHDLEEQKEKHSSGSSEIPVGYARTALPCWSFPFFFFSRDWWAQNSPFTDWNQINVMGLAAMNGSHVSGCRRTVRLSPPHVISA